MAEETATDTGLWACVIKTDDHHEALATSGGRLVAADDVNDLRELFGKLFVREIPVHRQTQLPLVRPADLIDESRARTGEVELAP